MSSTPEFFGRFPIRSEVTILSKPPGPSEGEKEFQEHGTIALRVFMAIGDPRDNRLPASEPLTEGMPILVRGKTGGYFMTSLEKDHGGWFVRVGMENERLPVTIDAARGLWVVRELL